MRILPIIAENWKMDGGVAFGAVPRTLWKKLVAVDQHNLIKITSRCLLVEEGNRIILFDTGMGRKQNEKYYGYRHLFGEQSLEQSLERAGYSTFDITDVVFTHLHDDHCGGALTLDEDGEPQLLFPKAMHHCSRAQWEWANHPNKREIGSFFPSNFVPLMEAGLMNLLEEEGSFTDRISFRIMNGHTTGMLVPVIQAEAKTLVFTADFIPLAGNIPLPFIASVDIQPLEALREKEQFLAEAVEQNYYLVFEHDYDVEACSLEMTEKGVRMKERLTINEILM